MRRLERVIDQRMESALSLSALDVAIDLAAGNHVEGDYYEFGVYRGKSFIRACKRFTHNDRFYRHERPTHFVALDSFEGLAEPGEAAPSHYGKGAYSASEHEFVANLRTAGLDLDRVKVIRGWYRDLGPRTKESYALRKASVVYLDCDLYESARDALAFMHDLLQDGTVVVFDDFFRRVPGADAGVARAWREFLEASPGTTATLVHRFRRVAFEIRRRGTDKPE